MKFLKYLLYLIVALVLFFFAKGIFTPSVSYESEVTVDKSAKEAWAVMSDESKMPTWIKGFKRTELISGTPNTVGAVSKVYVDDRGQEMVMEETITDIKVNEYLAMTFKMDFMNMDYKISFAERDGKTVIKSQSTTAGNGMMAKSMISFMGGAMKEQEDENLNSLKKLIEENTNDYFPNSEVKVDSTEVAIDNELSVDSVSD